MDNDQLFNVKAGEDPNEPSRTGGEYEDNVQKIPLEKRTGPLAEFPKAPDPKPFKITGQ